MGQIEEYNEMQRAEALELLKNARAFTLITYTPDGNGGENGDIVSSVLSKKDMADFMTHLIETYQEENLIGI
jgi:hypothetical protein